MEQELAYSFHLGSDKNKSKLAKKVSKGNVSGTTSLSNNAIQNANALSKVNKHNLREFVMTKIITIKLLVMTYIKMEYLLTTRMKLQITYQEK